MKIGDYVRTKDGRIAKIENMVDDFLWFDNVIYYTYSDGIDTLNMEDIDKYIIKSSPNIIDLIEVGDYVNGYQVIEKPYIYHDKQFVSVDTQDSWSWGKGEMPTEDIKSIVTKEAFESIKYEVD